MREVFRSSDQIELDFVIDILTQEGIAAVPLEHDNFRESLPTQIFVSEEDFSRATKLLQSAMPKAGP